MTEEPASKPDLSKITKVPEHVAIIMDGNGRWARSRGLARLAGHRAGTNNIRPILRACADLGITTLTIYAFSTENWRRPRPEVRGLFRILGQAIKRETKELHAQGVRVRHLGRLDGVSGSLRKEIERTVELTRNNSRITLNVAFNYGGRAELIDAVRQVIASGRPTEDVCEDTISSYMYTAGQPDPDLIIRTAGEMRISNFLIWQAAYAEYYTTPTYWPDFDQDDLFRALIAYSERERRFGQV